jgi:hypothetical protein
MTTISVALLVGLFFLLAGLEARDGHSQSPRPR